MKKSCSAMRLAGGQGSRLYALTQSVAKPSVPFGGKYRIIDFPLSNCANSGIDTVGVLTQYKPLQLNSYIGTGQPWDLDVSDEVSLPIGKLRVRAKGSAGGHNGLKSVIACLGSEDFPRVRIGVGAPPHPDYDMAEWVLSGFKNQDAEEMEQAAQRAAQAVECYILNGPEKTMNRFN